MLETVIDPVSLLLQVGVDMPMPQAGGPSLLQSGITSFVTTLVVGALLVAVVPDYTERQMAAVFDGPLSSFLYGFASLLGIGLLSLLLTITVVGILAVIPLVVVAYVIWAVGATVGFLAISDRLVGDRDGWLVLLVVAAGLNGGLAITGIGGIISFAVGAIGFGTVLQDYFE